MMSQPNEINSTPVPDLDQCTDTTAATRHPCLYDGDVGDLANRLTAEYVQLWWSCPSTPSILPRVYDIRAQLQHEEELAAFLRAVVSEADAPPRTEAQRRACVDRIQASFARLARGALGFSDSQLDTLMQHGLLASLMAFARQARQFDPTITGADIFQAARNVSTMNGLQLLMGLPVALTSAIFGYSMLYPYTDNYLDDTRIRASAKAAHNRRFTERLLGQPVDPSNIHEQHIWRLVAQIEDEFPRHEHPQVHQALLAIQQGQTKSLQLLNRDAAPYQVDTLGITIEKGGASVLAEGSLIAGELTEAQARFTFGWGAFLQFADDLQDTAGDRKDGLMTVFSQSSRLWHLDQLANRTFHFATAVLEQRHALEADSGPSRALSELLERSAYSLMVDAVGRASRHFSYPYVQQMQSHSPFRYAYLRKVRHALARKRPGLMRLVEAFANEAPHGHAKAASLSC